MTECPLQELPTLCEVPQELRMFLVTTLSFAFQSSHPVLKAKTGLPCRAVLLVLFD